MPYPATYPILFEELKSISVQYLKQRGFLFTGQISSGTVTWYRDGELTGQIYIWVNLDAKDPYLELSYNYDSQPIRYLVPLTSIPSNLGKGVIWYFYCPASGQRCRKLHLVNGLFIHRTAFIGLYEKQTYSHRIREMRRTWDAAFDMSDLIEELEWAHQRGKNFYRGKPTRRYMVITNKLLTAISRIQA